MKKALVSLIAVTVLLGTIGCEKRSPVALGNEWEIYVVADDDDWTAVKEQILGIFEKKLVTPQMETTFEVKHVAPADFKKYLRMRNLVIVSSLQPGTETDRIVRRALKDELYDRVTRREEYLFVARNQWAREQFIVVVAAPGKKALQASLAAYPDYLFRLFDHERNDRMKFAMFKRSNGRLEKQLRRRFGWSLKIPPYYEMAAVDSAARIVHLRSPMPERHLLIHWIDHPQTKRLQETALKRLIERLGNRLYNAEITPGYAYSTESRFLGLPAQEVIGLWQSRDDAKGGPLHVTSFYSPKDDRLYVLIRAVYAPKYRKEPYLRELRLVSETLSPGTTAVAPKLTLK